MRRFPVMQIAIGLAVLVGLVQPAAAATETVLYSFPDSSTGYPMGSLYLRGGSFYGTGGGNAQSAGGQVFKLTNSGGSWKETTLLTFDGTNGSTPYGGPVRGPGGVYYGTTSSGDMYNGGNVFALSKSGGKWLEKTIWAFGGTSGDGVQPTCDLVIDKSGNLYGTTFEGGTDNLGTVFEVSNVNGTWTETVLYSFKGNGDGWNPYAGLLMVGSATFYGTTQFGGPNGDGAVFKLSKSQGAWKEEILYSFTGGADGGEPLGTLIMDKSGALYGTTEAGGVGKDFSDVGVAFKLSLSGNTWTESVLHAFGSFPDDGENPIAGLTWGPSGTLYGTTSAGGGTVFQLKKSTPGSGWTETILHRFRRTGDGYSPQGGVTLDREGNLYGTTVEGGTSNLGAVWEIVP